MGTHSAPEPIGTQQPTGTPQAMTQQGETAQGAAEHAGPARPNATNLWSRWRDQRPGDRRWQMLWAVVGAIAVAIAAVCFTIGAQSRAQPEQPDHTVVRAAADGVTALMTFGPDDSPQQRTEVAKHLTGTLAADYAARGPDVVFPNAVASKISMKTTVSSAAAGESHADFVTVLVYATQEITVGQREDSMERVGIARWVTVTKVEGDWRVSRVANISPQ